MTQYILLIASIVSLSIGSIYANLPYQFNDVGINNTIGTKINAPLIFTDEFNKEVDLNDIVSEKPSIINFVYLNCPLLCHLLLDGLVSIMNDSQYSIQKDYQIISISIDPNESNTNLKKHKEKYNKKTNAGENWLFLKGTEANIKKITSLLGYRYKYIKRTNDYAHPSVLYFYNGKLTNYLEGVSYFKNQFDYSIMQTKATQTIKEKIITFCYYFDPDNQTYSFYLFNLMRAACLLTVLIIGIFILKIYMKEKSHGHH
jgi:protein SCO1